MPFDWKSAKAAGYSDAEIEKYLAEKDTTSAPAPAAFPTSWPAEKDPGVPFNEAARKAAIGAIPAAAGIAATMAVPEAAPLAWLLRMAAAGVGGGTGKAGQQIITGQPLDPREIGMSAAENALGQGVGEGLSAVAGAGAEPLMKRALAGTPRKIAKAEIAAASRAARAPVEPADATLAKRALSEGVAPGGGFKTMNDRIGQLAAKRDAILTDLGNNGVTVTRSSAVGPNVQALREKWARLGDPDLQDWLTERLTQFQQEARVKLKGGKLGKIKQQTPADFNADVQAWDNEAKALHEQAGGVRAKGKVTSDREAQFLKAVADDGRMALRRLTPNGELEAINREMYTRMPLRDALKESEISMGVRPYMNWHEAVAPSAMGLGAGALLGHPLEGAALATGAERVLSHPAVAGRAALLLNDPAIQRLLRIGPLGADAALRGFQGVNQ